MATLPPVVFATAMNTENVGMKQTGHHVGLTPKPDPLLRVAGRFGYEQLQRVPARQPRMLSQIRRAHPAGPRPAHNLISSEDFTDRRPHGKKRNCLRRTRIRSALTARTRPAAGKRFGTGRLLGIESVALCDEARGGALPSRSLVRGQHTMVFHGSFAIRNTWPKLREMPLPAVSAASAHPHG
jgi:hypothetical protein